MQEENANQTENTVPSCIRCDMPMEAGFLLDHGHGTNFQTVWCKGTVQHSIWVGIKQAQVATGIPTTSYRCPQCGYLETYAIPTPPTPD
ncbi:MAG: hypothetical protein JSR77_08920 [Planctomycetes bacterium]|nr:hypothetical protein [Planctomycetota bacterium]